MHTLSIDSKAVSIFQTGISGVPVIYLNTYSEEGQQVFEAAQAAGYPPFTLVAISDLDWNHDMAPWDSPAAFKKGTPFTGGADDYTRSRKRLSHSSGVAGDRWVLFGWPIRSVRHLPDGCVLAGGVHVRLPVVSWFQGVHLLPRAKETAGLHLLLPGGQRGQNPQSGSENSSGKYRNDPGFLPEQRHRHGIPAESRQPLCPGYQANRCGYSVAVEQVGDCLSALILCIGV